MLALQPVTQGSLLGNRVPASLPNFVVPTRCCFHASPESQLGSSTCCSSLATRKAKQPCNAAERASGALQEVPKRDLALFLPAADSLLSSMEPRQALAAALVRLVGHSATQVTISSALFQGMSAYCLLSCLQWAGATKPAKYLSCLISDPCCWMLQRWVGHRTVRCSRLLYVSAGAGVTTCQALPHRRGFSDCTATVSCLQLSC